jgi:hypothetical protein
VSDEEPKHTPTPRKVTLDVTLKREAHALPAHIAAPWTTARTWVLIFFAVFCAASWFAWIELRGHPIASYVSALPQLAALFAALTTLLGGGDPNAAKNWYQARATTLLQWIDRRARHLCTGFATGTLLLWYAGASMVEIDVQCPPGCQLSYGHLGAVTACDSPHDRVWAPLGLNQVVPTFECSMTGGHDEWEPLRRVVRDDDGSRVVYSCYEDGGRVESHASDDDLDYLEYGWAETRAGRAHAPCDHLPVGIYSYDPVENTCTWRMTLDQLGQAFRDAMSADADAATRDSLARLLGSECHDCPIETPQDAGPAVDAGVSDASADAAPSPLAVQVVVAAAEHLVHRHRHEGAKPDSCDRPDVDPFAFFQPNGCHGEYGEVVLELSARADAIPIGISDRGDLTRRCVPAEVRRDGYIHFFLTDGELVFGLTTGSSPRVLLLEDIRTTVPPTAVAATCAAPAAAPVATPCPPVTTAPAQ